LAFAQGWTISRSNQNLARYDRRNPLASVRDQRLDRIPVEGFVMDDSRFLRCNTPRPELVNECEVRGFCEWFHDYAATAVEAKRAAGALRPNEPGLIQCMWLKNLPDEGKERRPPRYQIGEHKRMADDALCWAAEGWNVYVRASLVRNDLEPGKFPNEPDATQVLALVADYDGVGALLPDLIPSFTVNSSAKNRQYWFLMNATYEGAYPTGVSLRRASGMDKKTGCVGQFYRLPGTPNYPTVYKIENENRDAEPTLVSGWSYRIYLVEQLRGLLPPCDEMPPDRRPVSLGEPSDLTIEQLDAKFRAHGRKGWTWLSEPTGKYWPKEKNRLPIEGTTDRSKQFWSGVRQGFRADISPADMHRLVLAKYRHGCATKYFDEHASVQEGEAAIGRIIEGATKGFPSQVPRLDFSDFTVNGQR
jgi:hypothetical protein